MKNEKILTVTWSPYSFTGQERQAKTC